MNQSAEKERVGLSGHSGRGHLVLICILIVNKLCRRPAAHMGVAKSDFSQMRRRLGADQI